MTDLPPVVPDPTARLAASRAAFIALQPRVAVGEPWPLAEDFGTGPEASWGPREVLAHTAEMLPYWLGEYERIVEAGRPPGDGVPFGRVATDAVRVGILERDRTVPLRELFARIDVGIGRWERRLQAAPPGEGTAVGLHPSRGEMTADRVCDQMVVSHLEEHVDQLERILRDR
jgi:hypothetical protein